MNWYNGGLRGSGRTINQMESAPRGAIFICPRANPVYFRELAKRYPNITKVVADDCLDQIRGYHCPIIVDHSVTLTADQRAIIHGVMV